MRREVVQRIQTATGDGARVVVLEREVVVRFTPLSGPASRGRGSLDYVTADGRAVNWIDDQTFELVDTGARLRRV